MSSSLGKVAIVFALLIAIAGVIYLKGQQAREASTVPEATVSTAKERGGGPGTTAAAPPIVAEKPSPAPSTKAAPAVTLPLKQRSESRKPSPKPTPAPPATSATVTEPATPVRLPRLLELGADKCVPCKMMQPVLAELSTEYAGKLQVDFIDVWKEPSVGDKYGVQMIPTQIFFDASGKELFRHTGFYPKDDIVAKFAELGITL